MEALNTKISVLQLVSRHGFTSVGRPKENWSNQFATDPNFPADCRTFIRLALVHGLVHGTPYPGLILDLRDSSAPNPYEAYLYVFGGMNRLFEGLRIPHIYDGPIPPERPKDLWSEFISLWSSPDSRSVTSSSSSSLTRLRLVMNWKSGCSMDDLPPSLTHLTTSQRYNQPLDRLPPTLKSLRCGFQFNQPLSKLPYGLTHLHLDYRFNSPIDHLPDTCTHLSFSPCSQFSLPVTRWPQSLKHLELPYSYPHQIHCWPPHLSSLWMGKVQENLPPTLIRLHMFGSPNSTLPSLPAGLTHLQLGDQFNQPLTADHLPSGLLCLMVGDDFNQPVDRLPSSLTHLSLGDSFDRPVDCLPSNLITLSVGNSFDRPVDRLPVTLRRLRVGGKFNRPVDRLPPFLNVVVLAKFYENNSFIGSSYHTRTFMVESARFDWERHRFPSHVHAVIQKK